MNINLAPFNNLKARQAVNWAVDRGATVKLYGGANLAQPVCTFLPPGFPGHVDYCQYTKGGGTHLEGAPTSTRPSSWCSSRGRPARRSAIVTQDDEVNKAIGEYLQSLLTSIGYKATLKPISANIQFTYIQNTNNKVQISPDARGTRTTRRRPTSSTCSPPAPRSTPGSDSSINIAGLLRQDDRRARCRTRWSPSAPT